MPRHAFLCRRRGREAQVEVAMLGRELAQRPDGYKVFQGDVIPVWRAADIGQLMMVSETLFRPFVAAMGGCRVRHGYTRLPG